MTDGAARALVTMNQPPFREGRLAGFEAGNLTWAISRDSGRSLLQLRDSAGLAPASPIVFLASERWNTPNRLCNCLNQVPL